MTIKKTEKTLDRHIIWALTKKNLQEHASAFKKGKFDVVGFLLKLVLVGVLIWVFVTFFGKFLTIYQTLSYGGAQNPQARLFELLSIVYSVLVVFMVLNGVSVISRNLFTADDLKLFSAMPIGAGNIYVAKMISIYGGQVLVSTVSVLTINLTVAANIAQGAWFWGVTAVLCLGLPLISIAIASLLAIPFNALMRFLHTKFLLYFITVTAVAAAGLFVYFYLLSGVKELLLGDELKYVFSQRIMKIIVGCANWLYPGRWIAEVLTKQNLVVSIVGIALVAIVGFSLSAILLKKTLGWILSARISGTEKFILPKRNVSKQRSGFFALVKKEFLQIFRTPTYVFSYLSVTVVMPMMVYFCMSIGSSLATKLIGVNCNLELAVFLTLLFGALTNVFCATNISRDGGMFFSIKTMPVGWKSVLFSKILLCMVVTTLSQLVSAAMLFGAGFLSAPLAVFVFVVGLLCGFAQICFATRFDFNHAKFSAEEDGTAAVSSGAVSIIAVLGMAVAVLLGGGVLLVHVFAALHKLQIEYLVYVGLSVASVLLCALSCFYLMFRFNKKYYQFGEGGI